MIHVCDFSNQRASLVWYLKRRVFFFSHHNHYYAWKSLVLGLNHVHSTVFARVLASKWTMYTPDVIIYLTCASLCNRIWRRKKKMI